MPGTGLLLLSFLAYLVLGTGVFWALEGHMFRDPSCSFQSNKWELLQSYMCLDGPALDLLIRVRGQPGGSMDWVGARRMHGRDEGCFGLGSWELLSHRWVEGTGLETVGLCSWGWVAMGWAGQQ